MSSYFSIKLREKKTDKILSLNCWSRNNAVYQLFVNNISVLYADCPERDEHGDFKYDKNGCIIYKPTLYHKLTSEDFKTVLEEANKKIKFYKDLLVGSKDKQKAIANYIKLIAKTTTKEEIPTTKGSAKSLATINVDDTTSTAIQAEVEQYKKQQEEQKKKDKELKEKAKKVLKDLDLGFESIEHLTVSNETDFTTISYLLSSVQIQDATNYIARLFNDKLNSFIEDAIELNNQKLTMHARN